MSSIIQVHISGGYKAKNYLTDSKVDDLSNQLLGYINDNRLEDGLRYIAEQLKFTLQPITPAHILLIIGLSVSVLFALLLSLFLFREQKGMNAWGTEQPLKSLEWLVYVITGVWIIKGTLVASMYVSHKCPYVSAGISIVAFFGLLTLYIREILT